MKKSLFTEVAQWGKWPKVSLMPSCLPQGDCLREGSGSAEIDIGSEGEGWREEKR